MHACHHRTLPGLWHPDPAQSRLEHSKMNSGHVKVYIISRRQVYLWVVVPQKKANKRVRYAFDQAIAWWLVGCVFYLVLECTCFWEKPDRVYLFLVIALSIMRVFSTHKLSEQNNHKLVFNIRPWFATNAKQRYLYSSQTRRATTFQSFPPGDGKESLHFL